MLKLISNLATRYPLYTYQIGKGLQVGSGQELVGNFLYSPYI